MIFMQVEKYLYKKFKLKLCKVSYNKNVANFKCNFNLISKLVEAVELSFQVQ